MEKQRPPVRPLYLVLWSRIERDGRLTPLFAQLANSLDLATPVEYDRHGPVLPATLGIMQPLRDTARDWAMAEYRLFLELESRGLFETPLGQLIPPFLGAPAAKQLRDTGWANTAANAALIRRLTERN